MEKIIIQQAQKATSPNSISLICAKTPEGITNLTTISWWTYLANKPPMIGFSISKKSYTGELISKNKRAVLSIPGEALAEKVLQCGRISGKEVDKAKEFDIALTNTEIAYPVHSKLAFMCSLKQIADAGDHTFYICEVDDIFNNEDETQLYSWEGYSRLAPL
jgi:flavin reductase (DIM6/NTAB) family NADH-FMN oxidoreductase RutF